MKDKSGKKHAKKKGNGAAAEKLGRKDYDAQMRKLHEELVELQEYVKKKGLKVCVVFEGRDGAGKGGTIKAITERVSPRVFRVIALTAPSERQKSQMYMQRYLPHMPAAGEVVIFDRSWYNRAGVERVMGFCTDQQAKEFLKAAPLVEKAIVHSGVILLKYWLEVTEEEQTRRLQSRIDDGRKLWKLTGMDLLSYSRWYDYSRARDAMFEATDTPWAPWYVAVSNDKKTARINIIKHFLSKVPHKPLKREKIKLPERQKPGKYKDPGYPYKYVDAK
jgi:polyphosphate kinase 2